MKTARVATGGGCLGRLVQFAVVLLIGAWLLRWFFYAVIVPLTPWLVGIGSALGVVLLGAWLYSRAATR